MEDRIKKVKDAVPKPKNRVAGKIVDNGKDIVSIRMAEFLLEIPREAIIDTKDLSEGNAILSIKPDAEILMTSVLPIEKMIGAISSRIMEESLSPDVECCECLGELVSMCICAYCDCDDGDGVHAFRWPTRFSRIRRF